MIHAMTSSWTSNRRGRAVLLAWALAVTSMTIKSVADRRARRARLKAAAAAAAATDAGGDDREADAAASGATDDAEGEAAAAAAKSSAAPRQGRLARMLRLPERLSRLIALAVPSWHSVPAAYTALLSASLCARTALNVKVSRQIGVLGSHLSARDWDKLWLAQIDFALWTIPAAAVAALVKFSAERMALAMRANITEAVHARYAQQDPSGQLLHDAAGGAAAPAGAAGAAGDGGGPIAADRAATPGSRISAAVQSVDNAAQRATEDVERLCEELARSYEALFKPTMEIVSLSYVLGRMMGFRQLLQCYGYFLTAGMWTRMVGPRFSALTHEAQEAEDGFRAHHARVVSHAEEVDFVGAGAAEASILRRAFGRVRRTAERLQSQRFFSDAVDGYVLRHLGTLAAFTTMVPAVYNGVSAPGTPGGVLTASGETPTEYFLSALHMLVNVAMALRDLAVSHKGIAAASALSARVDEHMRALDDAAAEGAAAVAAGRIAVRADADAITFNSVDMVTPRGEELAQALSFRVGKGQRLFCEGPNGCGKTALFRLMRGLWTPAAGCVTVPSSDRVMYLPQRQYLVPGLTLREQLTYPTLPGNSGTHSASGRRLSLDDATLDAQLLAVLRQVGLEKLARQLSDLDSTAACDGLSGGECQRLAIARLLLRRPDVAILDECTSGVSAGFDETFFQLLVDRGTTLITVSHRPTLRAYHTHSLTFDGTGAWEVGEVLPAGSASAGHSSA